MLGAAEKGYWKADKETLAQLSKALATSIAKNGAGCSSVICNTITIQNFTVTNLQATPGGQLLAGNYLKGIQQQTQGASAPAPAITSNLVVPAAVKAYIAKALLKAPAKARAVKPAAGNAPPGTAVQGHEIVTTSIKKLHNTFISPVPSNQKRDILFAGLLLLLVFGIGWIQQGLNHSMAKSENIR